MLERQSLGSLTPRFAFESQQLTSLPNASDSSKSISGLQDVISGMDEEVVNEVLLEVATPEESRKSLDVIKIKMEVLESENEKIEEEAEARREKEKKKKEKEEEKKKEKVRVLCARRGRGRTWGKGH